MNSVYFSKNWPWITIIGVAAIGFLGYLGWKLGIAISFAVLSIFVSTFFASRSLKLTQDSLELTRATTRPFLAYKNFGLKLTSNNNATMLTMICNTGVYPANNVSVSVEHFTLENGGERILWCESAPVGDIFPNKELSLPSGVTPEQFHFLQEENLYIRITMNYKHSITEKTHKTVHTGRITKGPVGISDFSLLTISAKCYWD